MSKAFTKDDADDGPLLVPPRPPLPAGVPNYVTPRGLQLLRAELSAMEAERSRLTEESDEQARRHKRAVVSARLAELAARIASAEVVDPRRQPHDEVRFGATVTLRTVDGETPGEERRFEIVGVDEADPAQGRIAFLAPIARAVLGARRGETVLLRTARGEEELEVLEIEYRGED